MNLQIIKSVDGKAEYVLLPIEAYETLKPQIKRILKEDYVPFSVEDYVSNPVALARIEANLTQGELANLLDVTQAYVSKLEGQDSVSPKSLAKVQKALKSAKKRPLQG